jgi:hypothetical protein
MGKQAAGEEQWGVVGIGSRSGVQGRREEPRAHLRITPMNISGVAPWSLIIQTPIVQGSIICPNPI